MSDYDIRLSKVIEAMVSENIQKPLVQELNNNFKLIIKDIRNDEESFKQVSEQVEKMVTSIMDLVKKGVLERLKKKKSAIGGKQSPLQSALFLNKEVYEAINKLAHTLIEEILYKCDQEVHSAIKKMEMNYKDLSTSWQNKSVESKVTVPGAYREEIGQAIEKLMSEVVNEI